MSTRLAPLISAPAECVASNKKLFTIEVEDQYSSSEAELFSAANDGALEYATIYGQSDISLVKSALPAKKTGDVTIHYFDIFGKGDIVVLK